jgi:hypothetical protein
MSKPKVHANGRSIVHAGDGLKHISAPPDVCKTPTPGGPQPVPYINVGNSSDLVKGSKRVKIGGKSIAIAGAELRCTLGNEPGTAGGGLVSGKTKGKAGWVAGLAGSDNVFVEGKGVVRFLDSMMHNGNTWNTAFQCNGHTGFAYADDFDGLCPICEQGPDVHRIHEHESTAELANRLIHALREARPTAGKRPVTLKGKGYMVAVMTCKCGQTWAAMSGARTHPGFVDVASRFATSRGHVATGGAVTMDQMWAANGSRFSTTGRESFEKAWDKTDDENRAGTSGYSMPGRCAAAKLLTVASGHLPVSMTERFFAPKKGWVQSYQVRQTNLSGAEAAVLRPAQRAMVLRNVLADPAEPMTFRAERDWTETVASCHTCQALLYMVMCEGDTRACG